MRTTFLLVGATLALGLQPAAAAERPFHVSYCSTASVSLLHEADGALTWALDGKGIAMSAEEGGLFHDMTFQCALVGRSVAGRPSGIGYCKYLDPDGDVVVWEVTVEGKEDTYRAVQGTGKWKGIKAQGKAVLLTKARPIAPDLRQVCRRFQGTVELPKAS